MLVNEMRWMRYAQGLRVFGTIAMGKERIAMLLIVLRFCVELMKRELRQILEVAVNLLSVTPSFAHRGYILLYGHQRMLVDC